MASTLLSTLDRLRAAIETLKAENARLAARNIELEEENSDLRKSTKEAIELRDRATLDAEYLAVSHKLADSSDTLIAARRRIAALIRNVDRCIELMKE